MQWLTLTHSKRWHTPRGTKGALYQSRYKSHPVQPGRHALAVCYAVERQPIIRNVVTRAEQWRWGSCWRRAGGENAITLYAPRHNKNWIAAVNGAANADELFAISHCLSTGHPFGDQKWQNGITSKSEFDAGQTSRLKTVVPGIGRF
jgi:putative transposase